MVKYKIIRDCGASVRAYAIEGFPGYFISKTGRVFSYKTPRAYDLSIKPKELRQHLDGKKSYFFVVLMRGGVKYTFQIHTLVCTVFNGKKPSSKYQVSHENGNSKDNHYKNLKWRLTRDNHKLKLAHGTDDNGHKNSRALFSKEQIADIRRLLKEGTTQAEVGRIFKTNPRNIQRIASGIRYSRS